MQLMSLSEVECQVHTVMAIRYRVGSRVTGRPIGWRTELTYCFEGGNQDTPVLRMPLPPFMEVEWMCLTFLRVLGLSIQIYTLIYHHILISAMESKA